MANHLYCRSCGASQIVPEFDRAFCPFCGLRVNKQQEFCHECCGHLVPEETKDLETKRPPFLQRYSYNFGGRVNRYIQACLLVGGLIFASITYFALTKTAIFAISFGQNEGKPPSQGVLVAKETGISQSFFQESASTPSLSAGPPQAQLIKMLNRIRKAQLNKDIDLFLSSFSPNFPELEEKRQKVLRTWQLLLRAFN